MFSKLYQFVRRHARPLKRAFNYPILLPHFTVTETEIRGIDGSHEPILPTLARALRSCDGSRRLSTIARQNGVTIPDLLRQHDQGRIILWAAPLEEPYSAADYPATVLISPHPDDAALSAFSQSQDDANFFQRLLIVNVFSKTAWWRFTEQSRDVGEVQRVRDLEERLVSKLMRARLKMLDLPEALLRGYEMRDVFQASVPERDADVHAAIRSAVRQLAPTYPAWLLPLGVGNHVDHLIARDASVAALRDAGVPETNISFYEDLPYAADLEGIPDFTNFIEGRRLHVEEVRDVGDEKLECLRVYWSQLTWSQIVKVGDYGKRIGRRRRVERIWTFAP
jgi:LmbE family N-acetylglucosaminyl deacetylase